MPALHLAEQRLAAEPASVRLARRAVVEAVGDILPHEGLDHVLLATSEVVTNAIEHGRGPIGFRIAFDAAHIRVEVTDTSPEAPRVAPRTPGASDVRGRGMVIVQHCTDRWGVAPLGDGKSVWFEVDVR
jgi:anti-sigma regulatory factor (Ser/Thr protein kinase)